MTTKQEVRITIPPHQMMVMDNQTTNFLGKKVSYKKNDLPLLEMDVEYFIAGNSKDSNLLQHLAVGLIFKLINYVSKHYVFEITRIVCITEGFIGTFIPNDSYLIDFMEAYEFIGQHGYRLTALDGDRLITDMSKTIRIGCELQNAPMFHFYIA